MPQTRLLQGSSVLVTRASHQAAPLCLLLKELGARVVEMPMISIDPPDTWQPLDDALRQIETYDWLVFASVNAVESCLKRISQLDFKVDLTKTKLAAIGPSTAEELSKHNLEASFSPSQFVAEALVAEFPGYEHLAGKRFLWPKTDIGRTYIADRLAAAGATIDMVPCYKTGGPHEPEKLARELIDLLLTNSIDIITLASAQTAKNLANLLVLGLSDRAAGQGARVTDNDPDLTLDQLLADKLIVVIGPETAKAARDRLGRVDVQPGQFTVAAMIDALCLHLEKNKSRFGKTRQDMPGTP